MSAPHSGTHRIGNRQVLLAEPDVDLLGQVAEKLRARGLWVLLARDLDAAAAKARTHKPQMLFVSAALMRAAEEGESPLAKFPELRELPHLILVRTPASEGLPERHVSYQDIDELVAEAFRQKPLSEPPSAALSELKGELSQLPLVDVLQMLAVNRRSGTLTVTTRQGAGELRIVEGDVGDAMYRRLEGEKAFYRLARETEGSFTFTPGQGAKGAKRIETPTAELLMDSVREQDELEHLQGALQTANALFAALDVQPGDGSSEIQRELYRHLSVPRPSDELLDDLSASDVDILKALQALLSGGHARRVAQSFETTDLCDESRLPVLRSLVQRLQKKGFGNTPRVAFAASPARIQGLAHTLLRVNGSQAPGERSPKAPLPYDLVTLDLGEQTSLRLIGVPLISGFSPLWSFVLPTVGVVVDMSKTPNPTFEAMCNDLEIRSLKASELSPLLDENHADHVAELVCAAIEKAGAGLGF